MSNFKILNSKLAFTLAEVLITLGIIGIIAEATIPTLMNNVNNAENKAAFKKSFSTMSQVMTSVVADQGSLAGAFTDNNSFRDLFLPYFKSVKSCNDGDSSCWTCNGQRTVDKFMNGALVTSIGSWWYVNRPTLVLNDGTMINFAATSAACTASDANLVAPYAGTLCGGVYVDVNGCKKPNTWGKDIFVIETQKDKLFPLGPSMSANGSSLACNKSATYAGLECAELVISNTDY